ncbi:MAG: CHAD domain-containing protein [Gemmatimonadota bacterium]|nr:CHAD domain-containing protein [Gemmatimonadota bacterium]
MARTRLERALEKAAPLLVPIDGDVAATVANEDVHGFRVALRRLRSWLRATRDLLPHDIPRARLAALRRISQRAGAARDAQVQWQWLTAPTAPAAPMNAAAARAAQWLAADRLAAYTAERRRLQHRAAAAWPALGAALADALSASRDPQSADGESLAEHLAPALVRHLRVAERALRRITHRSQVARIHRARIKVKRLRYLVEAIDPHSRAGMRAVRALRALQDALGELHDAHVMAELIQPLLDAPAATVARAPRQPSARRGTHQPARRDVLALRAAVRRRELAMFRQSMALAAAAASIWRDPARTARTLLSGAASRQVAVRTLTRPPASPPAANAPALRRG